MANLTARFQLIDQMSQKMADIANNGESMLSKWESAGDAASAALDGISSSSSNVEELRLSALASQCSCCR